MNIMKKRNCESCGMTMKSIEDFGDGNPENKYCKHCTDKEGNLKSYEEKVHDFKLLLTNANDYEEEQAIKTAKEMLSRFKAWKNTNI